MDNDLVGVGGFAQGVTSTEIQGASPPVHPVDF